MLAKTAIAVIMLLSSSGNLVTAYPYQIKETRLSTTNGHVTAAGNLHSANNDVQLECREEPQSGFGIVSGARFYRNGATGDVDPCIGDYPGATNGSIVLHITPECEGYYQCGLENTLSLPISLFAYPERLPNASSRINKRVIEGDAVTLPCLVRVSSLKSFNVQWFEWTKLGQLRDIDTKWINNEDYSLFLPKVSIYNRSSIYRCRIRARHFHTNNVLFGPEVSLTVIRRHASPKLSNINYVLDADQRHTFRVSATGTPELYFTWYLNDTSISSQEQASSTSEVKLDSLPSHPSELTVIVSNFDSENNQFNSSQTTFILPNMMIPPTDHTSTEATCSNSTVPIRTELSETEITLIIILSSTCFILILTIMALAAALYHNIKVTRKSKIAKPQTPSKSESNLPSIKDETPPHSPSPQQPSSSQEPPPATSHPQLKVTTRQDTVALYTQQSSNPANHYQMNWINPVSIILIKIGHMYRYSELKNTTLLTTLQHILIDALDNNMIVFDSRARVCIEQLRNDIIKLNDDIKKMQYCSRQISSRKGSRESTVVIEEIAESSSDLLRVNAQVYGSSNRINESSFQGIEEK